jgi:type IV pilus assembly protein PilC/MSHA biogenesis protein MshG
MPSFEYTAVNAAGQAESGTVLGITITDAVQQLATKGLTVEKINVAQFLGDPLAEHPSEVTREASAAAPPPVAAEGQRNAPPVEPRSYMATNVVGPLVGGVGINNLMFFFRQFGTMLDAGVPIVQTLDTLGKQSRDSKLSHVIGEIKGHVLAGRPISAGMQRYPEVFSPLHVSMVRAGEEGGFLALSLKQVAEYMEVDIRIRNQYKRALFMPKLTVIGSIVIIGLANWFISSFTTGATIWSPLTNWANWVFFGPILIGGWLFYKVGLANPAIRYKWDAFILKVPYLGHTLEQFAMAKFGRAFGALYAGGVPIPKAIQLAADSCGNEFLRGQIHPASRRLEEGDAITDTMRSTNAFTPLVLDMMHTGETTGKVDTMLTKVSEYYEDEAEVRSHQLGRVVGVLAIILVAIYVLIVLVKFYTGYFSALFNSV